MNMVKHAFLTTQLAPPAYYLQGELIE
uniref:Uncharacterized protein n=1 Tax=Arundo donax TaxID=35708 RepID=A0A0A9ARF1_ARUDO